MYTYTLPITAFKNDRVVPSVFQDEIAALDLQSATVDSVSTSDASADVDLIFDVEPSVEDKATVGTAAAAHEGNLPTTYKYHATSSLVEEKAISESTEWEYMASAVTTPSFFVADLSKFVGRVIGACNTVGLGAALRVLEDDASKVLGTFTMPDTGGEWQQIQFYSVVPPSPGTHEYILEGKLNGVTSARIRGVSMTVLEAVQSQVPSE